MAKEENNSQNVHSMPSSFKSGNFDYSVHPDKKGNGGGGSGPSKKKLIGLLILGAGVLVIGGLIFVLFNYYINPNDSSPENVAVQPSKSSPTNTNQNKKEDTDKEERANNLNPGQENPTPDESEEENKEEETEEDKIGDLNEEEMDTSTSTPETVATSTEEIATSTPETIATSTEETSTSTEEIATSTDETSTSTEEIDPEEAKNIELKDEDGDGLTNMEERLFLSSDNSPDTDGDGYSDFDEVRGLYNPVGDKGLLTNENISTYRNEVFSYETLVPKEWEQQVMGDGYSVMFVSFYDDFVQLVAEEKGDSQGILDWYQEKFPNKEVSEDRMFTKDEFEAIVSEDGLMYYLASENNNFVYTVSYVSVGNESIYPNVLYMMVKALSSIQDEPIEE